LVLWFAYHNNSCTTSPSTDELEQVTREGSHSNNKRKKHHVAIGKQSKKQARPKGNSKNTTRRKTKQTKIKSK
jgi:hypothetical protein